MPSQSVAPPLYTSIAQKGYQNSLRRRWLNLEACHGAAKPAVPFRSGCLFHEQMHFANETRRVINPMMSGSSRFQAS
eukprot:scaffold17322_cov117-Skeletonema_marinoi.AAC.7